MDYSRETIFHLPGIFEKVRVNQKLIWLYENKPEVFRDNVKIGSFYGAPGCAIWNGGRFLRGYYTKMELEMAKNFMEERKIPVRFTFTNCMLEEKHLNDTYCNLILDIFNNGNNEIICNSPILEKYLREKYGNRYKYISSTTKRLNNKDKQDAELEKDYYLVVIDYDYNDDDEYLKQIKNKDKDEEESKKNYDGLTPFELWVHPCNGGEGTCLEFLGLPEKVQKELLDFLRQQYLIRRVKIGKTTYHLSHSYSSKKKFGEGIKVKNLSHEKAEEIVWESIFDKPADAISSEKLFAYSRDVYVVGHIFTQRLGHMDENGKGMIYRSDNYRGYKVIDVNRNQAAAVPGAKWIDLSTVTAPIEGVEKDEKLLLVCARGRRSYLLQNRLKALGYTNTRALEGGAYINTIKVQFAGGELPPEEIKRVKGLGCLRDKRYPDVFNVRVITRNGKITSEEHRVIAEAAERFGSGAVAMTTRLTLEIQGVRHANIQPLIDFLAEHNLSTGGTGSLVRPVVSCKGTTCQYGLIDTFSLSEKIHEKFYVGYHGVTLPHKFKICVGGCPNNCAKPSLNDLGIVGQKVPMIDYSKCRGCTKCQVVENCPIKIAEVVDGKIKVDPTECNNCGRCAGKCPFGAFEEYQYGFKVFVGGRWGKKVAHGIPLGKIVTSEEEVMDLVERAILLFRDEGISGERFADTIERLGFDYVEDKLLNNKIDKSAILNKTVKGGATC